MSKELVEGILEFRYSKISRPLCDLGSIFKDVKVLPKDRKVSGSSSIQLLATLTERAAREIFTYYLKQKGDEDVFVKLGFDSPDDNGMEFEHSVYAYLRDLVVAHRTPNIMLFVGSFYCPEFMQYMNLVLKKTPGSNNLKQIVQQVKAIKSADPNVDTTKAYILILERGKGMSLYDCLLKEELSRRDLIQVLFQTFYTIHQIHIAAVNLNDDHLGNIWIDILDKPRTLVYFITDDIYFEMETRYIVKIFDFDKSTFTVRSIPNKKGGEWCTYFGACSKPDERRDIYTLLANIYPFGADINDKGIVSTVFKKALVETIVKDKSYLAANVDKRGNITWQCCKHRGLPCKKLPDNTCDPNFTVPEGAVLTFLEMCYDTVMFEWMRYSVTDDGYKFVNLPLYQIPTVPELPIYSFDNNVYISLDCTLSPMQMAEKLLELKRPKPKPSTTIIYPSSEEVMGLDTNLTSI